MLLIQGQVYTDIHLQEVAAQNLMLFTLTLNPCKKGSSATYWYQRNQLKKIMSTIEYVYQSLFFPALWVHLLMSVESAKEHDSDHVSNIYQH